MSCTGKPLWALKRGASFDLKVRIPSKFADGHFAGWGLQSAVRTPNGGLIATLNAEWVDPVVARFVHLQCLDTRAWPVGDAEFDVVLVSPTGFRWPTSTARFTVTDETLTELAPGDYFFLKNPRSSSVVIEDSTAGTPLVYVEGTHYEISDADHSRYRLLAHPATHVEPVTVDYAYAGYVNIAAFSKTNVERGIIFSGVNGDGQKGRMIIPRISLAMTGDFGWITNEASELTLGGQALYVPELQSDADFGPFMRIDLMPDLPV